MSTTSRGPSRRTLVKGAAWSVPVVAVAGAAPSMAASPGTIDFTQGRYCKNPGGSCKSLKHGFQFIFDIDSTYQCDVTVTQVGAFQVTSGSTPGALNFDPFVVPMGGSEEFLVIVLSQNSGNAVFDGYFNVQITGTCVDGTDTAQIYVSVDGTPPDCPCPDGDQVSSQAESDKATADVKVDQAPATTEATAPAAVEPAPAAPAPVEPAPVEPAPADGAGESSVP